MLVNVVCGRLMHIMLICMLQHNYELAIIVFVDTLHYVIEEVYIFTRGDLWCPFPLQGAPLYLSPLQHVTEVTRHFTSVIVETLL